MKTMFGLFLILSFSPSIFANPCKKSFQEQKKFNMIDLIEAKAMGKSHSAEEISYIVNAFTIGEIPDYQMSAWTMAVRLKGASQQEVVHLTKAMKESGKVLKFENLSVPIVDKHSTGGVGDKTSLILAPLCASCGLAIPMISGRGLGHTGGTLDKLESLRNFNVRLSIKEMKKQIKDIGFFIAEQTSDLVPADKKIYALRDVTATADSAALVASSVMSKKMAEGLDALVMDVKFGSGGLVKTKKEALLLAEDLKYIAEHNQVKFRGLITNMNQPLGRFIGNSLEMQEVLNILKNEIPNGQEAFYSSTRDLSLNLAAHMLHITGNVKTFEESLNKVTENLDNGTAFEFFKKMCKAQGNCNLEFPKGSFQKLNILSKKSGYIKTMETKKIGMSSIFLGAGRLQKEDVINPHVGIEMNVRLGDFIKKGEPLAILYYSSESNLDEAKKFFIQAISFSEKPVTPPKLIEEVL